MRLGLSCPNAVLLTALSCVACKKIIQVNLVNVSPQIVIEGNITDNAGPYEVEISRSVNYAADNADRLSDGKYIDEPLFNDIAYLEPGSALLLTMNCNCMSIES